MKRYNAPIDKHVERCWLQRRPLQLEISFRDNVELIHWEQYIVLALTANNMRILVTGGIVYASSR